MVLTGDGELGFHSVRIKPERRLPHPRKAAGAQITQYRFGEVVTINWLARVLVPFFSQVLPRTCKDVQNDGITAGRQLWNHFFLRTKMHEQSKARIFDN